VTSTQDGTCPFSIERPVMRQRWERLTFLHWPFEPALVQGLLPDGLTADQFDGAAWVGLVPFFMRVATAGGRQAPWVSRFCETNVRTYVRDAAGRTGIWFFSLDAARLGAVAVARATYRLPYFWSAMRISSSGDQISYRCRRRYPRRAVSGGSGGSPGRAATAVGHLRVLSGDRSSGGSPGQAGTAASHVRVLVGDRYTEGELDARDHFLTARWILFSVAGGRRRFARAWHDPWPLHHARALDVDDGLVRAAGLPTPTEPPLVHYSPGVDVTIGRPERLL
jgi:uncharacterized protein